MSNSRLLIAERYVCEEPFVSNSLLVANAYDNVLHREVLIYLVKHEHLLDSTPEFLIEQVRQAATLNHPNFNHISDVLPANLTGLNDPELVCVVVAAPLPHLTVAHLIKVGGHHTIWPIIGQAAKALDIAHQNRLRHLALTPDCIHIGKNGQVVISGLNFFAALKGHPKANESVLDLVQKDAQDLLNILKTGYNPQTTSNHIYHDFLVPSPGLIINLSTLLQELNNPHPFPPINGVELHDYVTKKISKFPSFSTYKEEQNRKNLQLSAPPRVPMPSVPVIPSHLPLPPAPQMPPVSTATPTASQLTQTNQENQANQTEQPIQPTPVPPTYKPTIASKNAEPSFFQATKSKLLKPKSIKADSSNLNTLDNSNSPNSLSNNSTSNLLDKTTDKITDHTTELTSKLVNLSERFGDKAKPLTNKVESWINNKNNPQSLRIKSTNLVVAGGILCLIVLFIVGSWAAFQPLQPVPMKSLHPTDRLIQVTVPKPNNAANAEPVQVESVQLLAPLATEKGEDSPGTVERVIDNNPNTVWKSWYYPVNARNPLPVGLVINLKNSTSVNQIQIESDGHDGKIEWRAADNPTSLNGGTLIASETFIPGVTIIKAPKPVETKTVVIWFAKRPVDTSGNLRLNISEIKIQ